MSKIVFLGAGSTIFAKTALGDCLLTPALQHFEIALYDIDRERLKDSEHMLANLKRSSKSGCTIKAYTDLRKALCGAKYVMNAVQIGGYDPCTITDFAIPKKYGLRQTIGDTVGIGGLFRALRTIPVMMQFAAVMRDVCPDAWLFNFTNPMAVLTNVLNVDGGIKTVGLCRSAQWCVPNLLKTLGIDGSGVQSRIAGINHMSWVLEVTKDGDDLYPEIRRRAAEIHRDKHGDMVRYELLARFGYFVTESSEHNAEYYPYFIRKHLPSLISRFNILLDEYPRRCLRQMERWKTMREELVHNRSLKHRRTQEHISYILEAMESGSSVYKFNGNVMNRGQIPNLPDDACVEIPCVADGGGVAALHVGNLPPQLAALNITNINTQLLTIEASRTGNKEHVYQAAFLDPHTSAELSLDDIVKLCNDMIKAHGKWLPKFG